MICPRCKREADTLWGHDLATIRKSGQCAQCCDDDTGSVVRWFLLALVALFGTALIGEGLR